MSREWSPRVIRASAGSGKTYQLTSRYLELLAAGVEPSAILATTFTRKAASEILDRVLARLAKAAGDPEAAKELAGQINVNNAAAGNFVLLLRRMLQTLHRVRISTLDSFFISLAGSFSLELGIPAGWSICEDADDLALRDEALERLLDKQAEIVGNLLPLLSKGEVKRSVHGELERIFSTHYEVYRGSERAAWESLQVPASPPRNACMEALEKLRVFDLSVCGHKGFFTARDGDIANFEGEDWPAFVASGLAKAVIAGKTTYQKKQIPPDVVALYKTLNDQAHSAILQSLADQTRATRDLLDHFHGELWSAKQATGALRFGEVTQALVDALGRQVLPAESWAFRLDGAVEHLLLDEFQDTAMPQWRVLEPMAVPVSQLPGKRSFFCVGDVKQAIYGWRGGMAGIFNILPNMLGPLEVETLGMSRRSAQPIIDVVNKVFGNLNQFEAGDKCQKGIYTWRDGFEAHTTYKTDHRGYVCLYTGPAQEGRSLAEHREKHLEFVAARIRDLHRQAPGRSIGVLCRKNDAVGRMIFELRKQKVEASEEGGNPLTDSPAVELILSLFALADHPGHSVAWFHLKNSPLREHLGSFNHADGLARQLRRELLMKGYGSFVRGWETLLAPACDQRDRSRLQQLVEEAYDFQERSTLRAADFVAWVRKQRVPDPSEAKVRVMTIHSAKGLEFDIVVLPELDAELLGQPPSFVAGRDLKSLAIDFVCRYANEAVQNMLTPEQQDAFARDRQQDVEESLSLLYVAMTRAKSALHMYIPGPRDRERKGAWYNLLLQTLASEKEWTADTLLYEHGDASWFKPAASQQMPVVAAEPKMPEPIKFRAAATERRRGMEHVAPSHREGQARVALDRMFNPQERTGMGVGTLHHAWFALIEWLDDGVPDPDAMRAAADKVRKDVPTEIWKDLDQRMEEFRLNCEKPGIRAVLQRSAYSSPKQPGFPLALAPFWTKSLVPRKVECERRFLVREDTNFLGGSLDRIVWLGDEERTVAADIIDFKTDTIAEGDATRLDERTEYYRPQLEAYRDAVAKLAHLPAKRIAARLVFTCVGKVVDV
jgi:ATP-dependent helicase/nuclease subunit A